MGWPVVTGGEGGNWYREGSPAYHDGDCAESGYTGNNKACQMEATVEGEGTVTFYWKVDSEENHDYLQFYLDGVLKDEISGDSSWEQKSYSVTGSGSHSLLWQYIKDGSGCNSF